MIILFLFLCLIFFINIRKNDSEAFLCKRQTIAINGLFVIIVFISHFFSYTNHLYDMDLYLKNLILLIGQLMVAPFLFFSGYGMFESIKKNKEEYKKNFINKRFISTYMNFALAMILYLILYLVTVKNVNVLKIFLSFLAWDSLGNSNWYIFDIFISYIIVFISLHFRNNNMTLWFNFIMIFLFTIILSFFKNDYWYNTMLLLPAGMFISFYKDKIVLNLKRNYLFCLLISILFLIIILLIYKSFSLYIIYSIMALFFVVLISIINYKFSFDNLIFNYLGKRVFWIYILQRLPMIIFYDKMNYIIYFIICIVITLLLTEIMISISKKVNKMLKI